MDTWRLSGSSVRAVLAVLAVLSVAGVARAASDEADLHEARRLVFLLEYIGADYADAVQGGRIVDAFEFDEVVSMHAAVTDGWGVLERLGAPRGARSQLARLGERMLAREPATAVRATAGRLVATLVEATGIAPLPPARPDPRRGEQLYRIACAICHGAAGGGDGTAAPWLDPPATSFRDERMHLRSPSQVQGAITFGVGGTAMPSFHGVLSPRETWDLAFYVLTLRDDFAPPPDDPGLPLGWADLVNRSASDLVADLERRGRPTDLTEIDYYRRWPPAPTPHAFDAAGPSASASPALEDADRGELAAGSGERAGSDGGREAGVGRGTSGVERDAGGGGRAAGGSERMASGGPPTASGLDVALGLQDAFAAVAERVRPSVVGVHVYARDDDGRLAPAARADAPSWELEEGLLYPGFVRVRSASGFVVDADGTVLTSYAAVGGGADGGPDGAPPVISVELANGRHVLARLAGAEPTVGLAVLALDAVPEQRLELAPAALGRPDELRPGHWVIALGDPWGPGRSLAVGVLADLAERQCYQESLLATLLQASLEVHPEAHGGPLADIHGNVVGMLVPPPPSAAAFAGRSEFALPIDLALNLARALRTTASRTSPWLGVSVLELSEVRRRGRDLAEPLSLSRTGVYVDGVYTPSPASAAGIRVGDCLVAIDGQRLMAVFDFQRWLYLSGVGRTVDLEIFRDGTTVHLRAPLEERPAAAAPR